MIQIFRIGLGLSLFLQSFFVFGDSFFVQEILGAKLHFHFPLFDALRLPELSPEGIRWLIYAMRVTSILILLGVFVSAASLIHFLSFLYLFLLEKSFYNNHFYLILLILFWMIFFRFYPRLSIQMIKFHVVLVYFYGGITKLGSDWLLRAEPMNTWLKHSVYGDLIGHTSLAYFLSWSGMIFDLWAAFMLMFHRVNKVLVLFMVLFHGMNHMLFNEDIGVFPILMLFSLVLFNKKAPPKYPHPVWGFWWWPRYVMVLFICVQLFLPLRHWFIEGNVMWNYEGNRFSWRMKDHQKYVNAKVIVEDEKGRRFFYPFVLDLTPKQIIMVAIPDMIYQYGDWLEKELRDRGMNEPKIYFKSVASMNGREYEPWINGVIAPKV